MLLALLGLAEEKRGKVVATEPNNTLSSPTSIWRLDGLFKRIRIAIGDFQGIYKWCLVLWHLRDLYNAIHAKISPGFRLRYGCRRQFLNPN
jgi:hypothetical protein